MEKLILNPTVDELTKADAVFQCCVLEIGPDQRTLTEFVKVEVPRMFRMFGHVLPTAFMEASRDPRTGAPVEKRTLVIMVSTITDSRSKDAFAKGIRQTARDAKAREVMVVSETWHISQEIVEKYLGRKLAKDEFNTDKWRSQLPDSLGDVPGATEAVHCLNEKINGEAVMLMAPIVEQAGVRVLGPFNENYKGGEWSGRMSSFLTAGTV